jgi:gas vesicle protein
MVNENHKSNNGNSNGFGVLAGLLIGGLAGAITMLLIAPQSGEETRSQIQKKGIELRDRTAEILENTMTQARSDGNKFALTGRQKAEELLHQGQSLVVEQLDRVAEAAQAGKKAIQNS